ncbi:hypothetical protein AB4Y90_03750 [Chryseobacterium sp. 2TAF14]|uniref:hypothetical protein n=1 Tax=Chryseobacterium sp. 2TAF14 TaxID=3233007 RepID=UPI003F8FE180
MFTSCQSDRISSEEYLVINKAIGHILQPYGIVAFDNTKEFNDIVKNNGINPSHMSQEDLKKLNEIVSMRRGYEFAIEDTLAETDTKSGKYTYDLRSDSIVPIKEKISKTVMDSAMLRFPENYIRVKTIRNPETFLGKIKLERVIFDESKEKALVFYTKCKKMENKECMFNTISLIKKHNEWYIRH